MRREKAATGHSARMDAEGLTPGVQEAESVLSVASHCCTLGETGIASLETCTQEASELGTPGTEQGELGPRTNGNLHSHHRDPSPHPLLCCDHARPLPAGTLEAPSLEKAPRENSTSGQREEG